MPDDVLLFRYSAFTFNGHRIHYDRRYATEVEGYPGLIVHVPLIATLILDLLRWQRPEARLRLAFRLLSPRFDSHRSTERHKSNRYDTRIVHSRSTSNHEKSQWNFSALPLLCQRINRQQFESIHV